MRKKRRTNFTLLELMVCIAILGIVASAITWNLKGLLTNSNREHNIGKFRVNIQELKFLALTHRADFYILLSEEGGDIYYQNATDEPISLNRKKQLLCKQCSLSREGKALKSHKITFFSSGWIEPKGNIDVMTKGDSIHRWRIEL